MIEGTGTTSLGSQSRLFRILAEYGQRGNLSDRVQGRHIMDADLDILIAGDIILDAVGTEYAVSRRDKDGFLYVRGVGHHELGDERILMRHNFYLMPQSLESVLDQRREHLERLTAGNSSFNWSDKTFLLDSLLGRENAADYLMEIIVSRLMNQDIDNITKYHDLERLESAVTFGLQNRYNSKNNMGILSKTGVQELKSELLEVVIAAKFYVELLAGAYISGSPDDVRRMSSHTQKPRGYVRRYIQICEKLGNSPHERRLSTAPRRMFASVTWGMRSGTRRFADVMNEAIRGIFDPLAYTGSSYATVRSKR